MSIDISLHRCDLIRVRNYHPNNGNSIQLVFEAEDGEIHLSLYGLPTKFTEYLLHDFSDEATKTDHDVGRKPTGETT